MYPNKAGLVFSTYSRYVDKFLLADWDRVVKAVMLDCARSLIMKTRKYSSYSALTNSYESLDRICHFGEVSPVRIVQWLA